MRCVDRSHRHHVARRSIRRFLVLSRNLVNIFHPWCSPALVTKRDGQRFSLISCADYQATITSRNLQRESASSNQIFGFHVVCGQCDGFVVRNGILRSCQHQRDSASIISENSRKAGREGTEVSGAQATDALAIIVQPPTPVSNQQSDSGAESLSRETHLCSKNIAREGLGSGDNTIIKKRAIAQKHNANWPDSKSETLMQNWTSWSQRWEAGFCGEKYTLAELGFSSNDNIIERSHCDTETLMQDWRDWSGRWEQSVKSR